MGEKTSHGIWASQERMESFDDVAERYQDRRRYSRSQAILEAMELYETILETMDELDWPVEDMDPRDQRASVRQALIESDRREQS